MATSALLLALSAPLGSPGLWSPAAIDRYRRVRSGVWLGSGTLQNTLNGALLAHVEVIEIVSPLPADAPIEHEPSSSYRTERLLVYRHANGTLLTRYNRRAVPPVRYSHDVVLSLGDDGARETPALLLRAYTPAGREVARAWDTAGGPRRRGLSRSFELALRPHRPSHSVSRYAREQKAKARERSPPPPLPRAPRARRAFFGSQPPAEPSVQQPAAAAGATREEYALVEAPLRWEPPLLFYSRTGRGASWCGSTLCTLEVRLRKVDEGWLFGSPSSRRLAAECIARVRAE
ncbi:hypothetical protein AB1Y20_007071 [Prymnesium parvum]|uniref:Uncharacterized protein n=1 Tax=Prymnesium parvum TaxID=97485 RepID=A0AB34J2L3_PRYPA